MDGPVVGMSLLVLGAFGAGSLLGLAGYAALLAWRRRPWRRARPPAAGRPQAQ